MGGAFGWETFGEHVSVGNPWGTNLGGQRSVNAFRWETLGGTNLGGKRLVNTFRWETLGGEHLGGKRLLNTFRWETLGAFWIRALSFQFQHDSARGHMIFSRLLSHTSSHYLFPVAPSISVTSNY